jgi:hypothetical protein
MTMVLLHLEVESVLELARLYRPMRRRAHDLSVGPRLRDVSVVYRSRTGTVVVEVDIQPRHQALRRPGSSVVDQAVDTLVFRGTADEA